MLSTKLTFSRRNEEGNLICSECNQTIYADEDSVEIWGSPVHQTCADRINAGIEEEMLRRGRV